jgi:hypothetical protein
MIFHSADMRSCKFIIFSLISTLLLNRAIRQLRPFLCLTRPIHHSLHSPRNPSLTSIKLTPNYPIFIKRTSHSLGNRSQCSIGYSLVSIIPYPLLWVQRLNCFPIAPPDDKILGFLGVVDFLFPSSSAARWIGLSSPLRLREVIVNVRVLAVKTAVVRRRVGESMSVLGREVGCGGVIYTEKS